MQPAPFDRQDAPSPGVSVYSGQLACVFAQSAATSQLNLDVLHEAVSDYVRQVRAAGQPPEQVLAAVKGDFTRQAWRLDREHFTMLLDRVVTWCIEEYYRAD